MAEVSLVELSSDECHKTSLMISQHWFRWLAAIRQQAITSVYGDPNLSHHMASLGHNELTSWGLSKWMTFCIQHFHSVLWKKIGVIWCRFSLVTLINCWQLDLTYNFLWNCNQENAFLKCQLQNCCHFAPSFVCYKCNHRIVLNKL